MISEGEGNVASVQIESAKYSDGGRYICYGINNDRTKYNTTSIEIEIEAPSLEYNKGENVRFNCDSNDNPNDIEWKKLDGEMNRSRTRITGNVLDIIDFDSDLSGVYVCFDKVTKKELKRVVLRFRTPVLAPPNGKLNLNYIEKICYFFFYIKERIQILFLMMNQYVLVVINQLKLKLSILKLMQTA